MPKQRYSSEQTVQKFMESFHFFSNLEDWPYSRARMRADKLAKATFNLNERTGEVHLRRSPLKYKDAAYVGSHFRKFITASEPTYLPNVVSSVRELGINGHLVDEVESQAEQTTEPRFEFIVDPDTYASVGMKLEELPGPVRWNEETDLNSTKWKVVQLSTRDATEVFFNEGALHPFEPVRREEARAPIRSAPKVYQTFLAHLAIASTVYATGALHLALNDSRDQRWHCGAFCQERRIIQDLRRNRSV